MPRKIATLLYIIKQNSSQLYNNADMDKTDADFSKTVISKTLLFATIRLSGQRASFQRHAVFYTFNCDRARNVSRLEDVFTPALFAEYYDSMTDLELFARLIQCEAGGEGDTGMRAVATVVMNRVNALEGEYGRYPTLRDVIFAPYQFDCAMTSIGGQSNPQNLYNMNPTEQHYEIAEWAIGGGKLNAVGNALWFYNPFSSSCRQYFPNDSGVLTASVGKHCFYSPTQAYYYT